MALRAASSLMSYTHNGCSHSRPVEIGDDGLETAAADWILECGPCEASLAHHELWGPATEPAPLTADEIRLRDAQHQDATRNLWQGLANMPDQLAMLAMQNQATMQILAKLMGVDLSNGLPPIPAGALPPGMVAGQAPAVPPPPAPPVQDAVPPAAAEKAAKKTTAPRKSTPRTPKPKDAG